MIFSDDVADACIYFLKTKTNETLINIGSGKDKTIIEYAKYIMKYLKVNYEIVLEKKKINRYPKKSLRCFVGKKIWMAKKNFFQKGFIFSCEWLFKEKLNNQIT